MQELTDDELKSLIDSMESSVILKEDSVLTKDILKGLRELKNIRDLSKEFTRIMEGDSEAKRR
jgi:hypothetical protein